MQRKLAAILAADVVGYSKLMAEDEAGTLSALREHRHNLFDPETSKRGGRIVKLMGDGTLVEYPSVVDAVECALAIQQALATADSPIKLRIGINLGDVIIDGDDIYGDGVNIAARLEALAEPGGICIASIVYESLGNRIDAEFTDAGEHEVKNIDRPIRVFQWPANSQSTDTKSAATAQPPQKPTIAILPFDNMSSDPEQDHLADGLCEDLTTALSKIDTLSVISRTAAFAYKDTNVSAVEAAHELGATYAVEGSVRAAGNRVRINAQLIERDTSGHIWAEKYDGTIDDIFELQDRITQQIVTALEVQLSDGEQVIIWHREAGDPRAYEAFISARAAYKEYSRAGTARAKKLYEQALAISPGFASAHVGMARLHLEDANFGWSSDQAASLAEARRYLDNAFELDKEHVWARAETGHLLMVEGEFEAAHKVASEAVAADPNSADVLHVLSTIHVCLKQPSEALRFARECVKRNPATPEFYLMAMAEAHIILAEFDKAQSLAQRVIASRPDWLMAYALSAISYQSAGDDSSARLITDQMKTINPRFTATRWRNCIHYPNRDDVPALKQMLIDAGLPE